MNDRIAKKWKVAHANICQSLEGDEAEETILQPSELVDFAFTFALQGSREGKYVFSMSFET